MEALANNLAALMSGQLKIGPNNQIKGRVEKSKQKKFKSPNHIDKKKQNSNAGAAGDGKQGNSKDQ